MNGEHRYLIKPRWHHLVTVPLLSLVIIGIAAQQPPVPGDRAMALGTLFGALAVIMGTVAWPAYKGLKMHRECRDVSEVVVGEQGVRVLLASGDTISVTQVEGAELRTTWRGKSKAVTASRIVLRGTLPDGRSAQRTIFRQNLPERTYRRLMEDVARTPAAITPDRMNGEGAEPKSPKLSDCERFDRAFDALAARKGKAPDPTDGSRT